MLEFMILLTNHRLDITQAGPDTTPNLKITHRDTGVVVNEGTLYTAKDLCSAVAFYQLEGIRERDEAEHASFSLLNVKKLEDDLTRSDVEQPSYGPTI